MKGNPVNTCALTHDSEYIDESGADPGFGQGEAPTSEAESCRRSEVELCERSEQSATGVQGP